MTMCQRTNLEHRPNIPFSIGAKSVRVFRIVTRCEIELKALANKTREQEGSNYVRKYVVLEQSENVDINLE